MKGFVSTTYAIPPKDIAPKTTTRVANAPKVIVCLFCCGCGKVESLQNDIV